MLQRQVGSFSPRPVTSAVSAATFSGICLIVDLFQVLAGQQESGFLNGFHTITARRLASLLIQPGASYLFGRLCCRIAALPLRPTWRSFERRGPICQVVSWHARPVVSPLNTHLTFVHVENAGAPSRSSQAILRVIRSRVKRWGLNGGESKVTHLTGKTLRLEVVQKHVPLCEAASAS